MNTSIATGSRMTQSELLFHHFKYMRQKVLTYSNLTNIHLRNGEQYLIKIICTKLHEDTSSTNI